jgi:hypothetical protein
MIKDDERNQRLRDSLREYADMYPSARQKDARRRMDESGGGNGSPKIALFLLICLALFLFHEHQKPFPPANEIVKTRVCTVCHHNTCKLCHH